MKPETYKLDFNSFFDLINQTFITMIINSGAW